MDMKWTHLKPVINNVWPLYVQDGCSPSLSLLSLSLCRVGENLVREAFICCFHIGAENETEEERWGRQWEAEKEKADWAGDRRESTEIKGECERKKAEVECWLWEMCCGDLDSPNKCVFDKGIMKTQPQGEGILVLVYSGLLWRSFCMYVHVFVCVCVFSYAFI